MKPASFKTRATRAKLEAEIAACINDDQKAPIQKKLDALLKKWDFEAEAPKMRATFKERSLLKRLLALADPENKGTEGERANAKDMAAKLRERFDFTGGVEQQKGDVFAGCKFAPASDAIEIYHFVNGDLAVASSVKWAIEAQTGLSCGFCNGSLTANVSPSGAARLGIIANHLAQSFAALLAQFTEQTEAPASDRNLFIMGLYDGAMCDERRQGEQLPARKAPKRRKVRAKKGSVVPAGLSIHPYSMAIGLGKSVRFSASIESVKADLEETIQKQLPKETK